jgi:hypothetical protein
MPESVVEYGHNAMLEGIWLCRITGVHCAYGCRYRHRSASYVDPNLVVLSDAHACDPGLMLTWVVREFGFGQVTTWPRRCPP